MDGTIVRFGLHGSIEPFYTMTQIEISFCAVKNFALFIVVYAISLKI